MIRKMDEMFRRMLRWIGILLVGYLFLQGLFTICCIQRVQETTYFMHNTAWRQIAAIVVTVCLGKVAAPCIRRWLERYGHAVVWSMLGMQVLLMGTWILLTQFWANGDMEKVIQYAQMLLAGDYSGWQPGGYPHEWPHQNGLILLVAGILRFTGIDQTYLVLYGMNLLFYAFTIIGLHYALRVAFPVKHIYCAQTICMIGYLPYAFYVTLLYGNVIGFGFAALALMCALLYVRKPSWGMITAAGCCMALGIIFKQNEMIILVAILLLLLEEGIRRPQEWRRRLAQLALFVVLVWLGMQLPQRILETASGMELEKGNSKWAHVAMGLMECDEAPGWYNGYNDRVFRENHFDTDATGEAALEKIAERVAAFLEEPSYAWRFFHRKLASEWNNPTFECFHIQNGRWTSVELHPIIKSVINDGGKLNILLIALMDIAQSVILFGVLFYLLTDKQASVRQLLFVLCFAGAFVFWGIWEAKCRYVISFYLMLIPYSVPGYRQLVQMNFHPVRLWRQSRGTLRANLREIGKGVCRIDSRYRSLLVLVLLVIGIALSQNPWIADAFKINDMTQDYYEYIHQFGQNLTGLRF